MSANFEPSDTSYDRFFPEEPSSGEPADGYGAEIPAAPAQRGAGRDSYGQAVFQHPVTEQRGYSEPRPQPGQPRSTPEAHRPNVVAWPRQHHAEQQDSEHPAYGWPPQSVSAGHDYGQPAEAAAVEPADYTYGQPADHNYAPPVEQSYAQPAEQSYAQPAEQSYGQQAHPYAPPAEHPYAPPAEQSYPQPAEQSYGQQAAAAPRSALWTSTAPPQRRSPYPQSAPPPRTRQQQSSQSMPDWLDEPVDSRRFVDQRVGDDEDSLTYGADRLDLQRARKLPAGRGWRKLLYNLTFHRVNLGLSPAEVKYADMVAAIRQPITGDYKLAVVSLKGGVGKTTTTVTLGSMFAELRKGDRVVALDANPDFGNLVSRVAKQTNTTVKDLLADGNLSRYGDVRRHTSQNNHGLEVVAGERDLAQSERFSKAEFERVMAVLEQHYSLILSDCGTGVINEAMAGVLDTTNGMILVSSVTIDGARAVSANIEWLRLHGYQHLVEHAVVVLNSNKTDKSSANIEQLQDHFSPYVRAVHVIPFDHHLAEGGEVNLNLLNKKTRRAFEELAEIIATDFPSATGKHTREG